MFDILWMEIVFRLFPDFTAAIFQLNFEAMKNLSMGFKMTFLTGDQVLLRFL